nr:substrate-binding domain-containing protein [Arthrobacter sp. 9MFCol3.1]
MKPACPASTDISVIGYDDQPEGAYFAPPLTTVNRGFKQLGPAPCRCYFSIWPAATREHPWAVNPKVVARPSTARPSTVDNSESSASAPWRAVRRPTSLRPESLSGRGQRPRTRKTSLRSSPEHRDAH